MPKHVRSQTLDFIVESFTSMTPETLDPQGEAYGVDWGLVTKKPLGGLPKGKLRVMGVYAGESKRSDRIMPFDEVELPVILEVYAHKTDEFDGDLETQLTELLAVVERRLNEDTSLGGVAHDISVSGEMVDIEGEYDNHGSAALYLTVKYSQRRDDPRYGR